MPFRAGSKGGANKKASGIHPCQAESIPDAPLDPVSGYQIERNFLKARHLGLFFFLLGPLAPAALPPLLLGERVVDAQSSGLDADEHGNLLVVTSAVPGKGH